MAFVVRGPNPEKKALKWIRRACLRTKKKWYGYIKRYLAHNSLEFSRILLELLDFITIFVSRGLVSKIA